MRVSVITACLNSAETIGQCLESMSSQKYGDVEHIIIDGGSEDGTQDIIREHSRSVAKFVSEPDSGVYDALNKGIAMATGDVVGVLHADDVFEDERVIADVADAFERSGADTCYGDLVYVARDNVDRIVRRWKSGVCRPGHFRSRGWMPPHPAFFVRREVYERFGLFDTRFRIAADYELMLRLLVRHRVSTCYVPRVLVRMRTGGTSAPRIRTLLRTFSEDHRAWKVNGFPASVLTVAAKKLRKLAQYFPGLSR